MKKTISLFIISLIAVYAVNAVTWTVSNNPDIPGQFTQIQEAIDDGSTSAGDTLLVAGSTDEYAGFSMDKPFVIIGAGINNPYGYNTKVENYVYLQTSAGFTPSGTRLVGIHFTSTFYMQTSLGTKTIENVVLERCRFDYYIYVQGGAGSTYQNDTIRNCYLKSAELEFDGIENLGPFIIHNNLFENKQFDQNTSKDMSGVFVKNNVFIQETSNIFPGLNSLVVHDNIFFEALPQGCIGCDFTNNTVYGTANDTLPGTGNNGSGNAIRDPKFVNYTDAESGFTFNSGLDFHLQEISDDDNSGTGGDERGMYGGLMPVVPGTNPAIPQMTEISFPDNASSVEEGGTLNVRFKAKKND